MNDTERIKAIEILNKLADREIGIRKGHKIILQSVIPDIEKQIPKKADKIKERHNFSGDVIYKVGNCPICKEKSISTEKYCIYCGQALDWSDSDE